MRCSGIPTSSTTGSSSATTSSTTSSTTGSSSATTSSTIGSSFVPKEFMRDSIFSSNS